MGEQKAGAVQHGKPETYYHQALALADELGAPRGVAQVRVRQPPDLCSLGVLSFSCFATLRNFDSFVILREVSAISASLR